MSLEGLARQVFFDDEPGSVPQQPVIQPIVLDAEALAGIERVREGVRRLEDSQRVQIDPNLTVNFNLDSEIAAGRMAEPPYMSKDSKKS